MLNFMIRGHDLSTVTDFNSLAEKTAEQGIHTIQLALGLSFPQLPSEAEHLNCGMGELVKRTLAKNEVSVGILSCYINMIHPDLAIREKLLCKFESYLENARHFGATMVASETGCVLPEIQYTEDNFSDAAFAELVQVVQRLVATGEKVGMMVGIEPGLNHPLYSIERVQQLLEAIQSPFLGIILDPSNLITSQNYQEQVAMVQQAFELFGEKIVAVHLKDYRFVDDKIEPVNIGEGLINYQAITDIVKTYKPGAFVVLEETKDDGIKRALELLQ
ncbi:sugar phosphate isomerase/epimerase [Enterococcus sp. PF1-24]|uniref:sugar phosphate isomerase/epimerase family protein n=1 Tax=unclassified Enterococcus TaxID=2608891 RepID=UPI002475FCAB|nr:MULTISPECIES: sugar phosphate isomerase/epimerase family protein [unclassified Enterococcus]MDH6364351.1 sugar phosphate isomerase/epimerase [Enterococcus sp. PFB1-1]MDH6401460.1 sugar phosphate isomerase/epimerase [Enterococcus sp. PF1-24]